MPVGALARADQLIGDGAVCLACGRAVLDVPRRFALSPASGESFALARCPNCGTLETLPRLDGNRLRSHYDTAYYGSTQHRFIGALDRFWDFCQRRRGERLQAFGASGSILDIGCGNGLFLANLNSHDWTKSGIEISEGASVAARARGLDVMVGDVTLLDLPPGSFDVVTMWHVLEHIVDVPATLDAVHRLLREQGLLVVGVPNIASWQASIGGGAWYHLDVPRHCHHFTAGSLRRILSDHGFDTVRVSHFALEYNWPGCVQTLYNRIGFPRNFLYGAARQTSAKAKAQVVQSTARRLSLLLLAAGLAPIIGAIAAPITGLESAMKHGGTIELYGRKR